MCVYTCLCDPVLYSHLCTGGPLLRQTMHSWESQDIPVSTVGDKGHPTCLDGVGEISRQLTANAPVNGPSWLKASWAARRLVSVNL